MLPLSLLSLLSLIHTSAAWIQSTVQIANTGRLKGFNYAADDDFATKFATAQKLEGAAGFASARLFSMKSGKGGKYTEAFEAAKTTGTTLLLGIWASGDPDKDPKSETRFAEELAALEAALDEYVGRPPNDNPTDLKKMVVGISVGSEDLYRQSIWGTPTQDDYGNTLSQINSFIEQVRAKLDDYNLRGVIPIGHVDTWSVWKDQTVGYPLAKNLDWIGLNTFPYWENKTVTDFKAFTGALNEAYTASRQGGNPPVWVTETGWPIGGPNRTNASPGLANAETYWNGVGCQQLFNRVNTWWYTLHDPAYEPPQQTKPQWAVTSADGSTEPVFELSCDGTGTRGQVGTRVKERGLRKKEALGGARKGIMGKIRRFD